MATSKKTVNPRARTEAPILYVNSDYGFLEFEKVEDLENFSNYLIGSTHAEIQEYLH